MGGWGLQKVTPASLPTSRASSARASAGPSDATLLHTALKDVHRAIGLHASVSVKTTEQQRAIA